MKRTNQDWIFDTANTIIMAAIILVMLFPFLHILAISLNEARDAAAGGIGIWPRVFSLDSYEAVFQYQGILESFVVSVSRTVIGTILTLLVTSAAAYVMTKKNLVFYKGIYRFFIVSMFVSGGLIPTFMLYKQIGLYNSFLVYILPGAFGVFYMILFRTYFIQLPKEIEESAFLDGAGEFTIFTKIMLPLSLPILATIGLFIAVSQWNSWQDTLFFTSDEKLQTLQFVLMKVLRQAEAASMAKRARSLLRNTISITPESIKMAITIVATLPILAVYPFLQKYFVKGIVVGAVKG
jgi:putative aldouronate transport system permease protein